MATNFPTSLDNSTSLPYPSSGNFTNAPSLAGLNDNQNDALIATQTKVGIGASTPTSGKFLTGTGTGTSAWANTVPAGTVVGTSDSQTLTNKTLTSPTISSPVITNATISTDLITGYTTSNTGTVYGIPVTTGVINTAGTINGASLVSASVGSTALATNAVQGNQLATSAITLGYAQITAAFSTTSATAVLVTGLTATVTIPSGSRKIKVTVYSRLLSSSAVNATVTASLWDGTVGSGTQIADFVNQQLETTGNPINFGMTMIAVVTPSAGSKTYNVGLQTTSGTANIYALSTSPAFILVEAI